MLSITREEIYSFYITKQKSVEFIANLFKCGKDTIRRKLCEFNIPMHHRNYKLPKERSDITKDILVKEYVENNKTMQQIANKLNCAETTILYYLCKYSIPRRNRGGKGRKLTVQQRLNISIAQRGKRTGEKSHFWKGGITANHMAIRRHCQYRAFRQMVLRIKGEKCEKCGKNLLEGCPTCTHIPDRHVHHIKPFSQFPEERFSFDNVIVLCNACHVSQHI